MPAEVTEMGLCSRQGCELRLRPGLSLDTGDAPVISKWWAFLYMLQFGAATFAWGFIFGRHCPPRLAAYCDRPTVSRTAQFVMVATVLLVAWVDGALTLP